MSDEHPEHPHENPEDEPSFQPFDDIVDRSDAANVVHNEPPWWKIGPSWNRVLIGVFVVLFVYYGVTLIQVMAVGRSHDSPQVDAIVVLGAAQYDGRPSPQLAARLDHVVTLWEQGAAPVVVVTGGKREGDRFTEAEASQMYLIDRDVPEQAIVTVGVGDTTYASLAAVATVLLDGDVRNVDVVLVSDPYHAFRSKLTAEEVGLRAQVSSTPTTVVTGWSSLRRQLGEAAGVAVGRIVGFERLSELTG